MSWKYVLVGLALVLLGNLLTIECRESHGFGDARGDESSVLSSLLNYLRNRRLDREPYDVSDEEAAIQEDSEDKNNKPQSPPSPQTGGDGGHGDGGHGSGSSGGRDGSARNQEIGAQVQEQPKAMPLHGSDGQKNSKNEPFTGVDFIMIVTGCMVLAAIGMVGAGVCWYKYHKRAKSASVVDYPAYGVTGPTKDHLPSPGDRKLAQSAQMYHYQHQKQQMIAMEKANGSMKHDASDEESEEDNVEGDYTVYECPGLAPTGEMEVKNPLFRGDETPSTPVNEEPPQPQDK